MRSQKVALLLVIMLLAVLPHSSAQTTQEIIGAYRAEVGLLYAAARDGDFSAVRELKARAEKGDAISQHWLGQMYYNGEGVPKNTAIGVQWYAREEKGYPTAQDAQDYIEHVIEERQRGNTSKIGNLSSEAGTPDKRAGAEGAAVEVALRKQSGVLVVPVLINRKIPLEFILDSGASDVSIPADVVSTLVRTGTLTKADFTGANTYVLADGSKVPSATFRIRSLKIGDRVLEDVSGSVGAWNGSLLLGQSFLSRFRSWSIDNARQVLILK